jgi:hypothetical protein
LTKKLKTRGNLYLVIREDDPFYDDHGHVIGHGNTAFIGSFSDVNDADDFKDACAAEWFDKTRGAPSNFKVTLITFYG